MDREKNLKIFIVYQRDMEMIKDILKIRKGEATREKRVFILLSGK